MTNGYAECVCVCVWGKISLKPCVHATMHVCLRLCRRGQAWDWSLNHKHVATDLDTPFSPLLLIPQCFSLLFLLCLPLHLHLSFSSFYILFPLCSLFQAPTFSTPHSIFSASSPFTFFPVLIINFSLLHSHPDAYFGKFEEFFKKFYCSPLDSNVTVLQYDCSPTSCTISHILPPFPLFPCISFTLCHLAKTCLMSLAVPVIHR